MSIESTDRTITLRVPCTYGVLEVHHELAQACVAETLGRAHTNLALLNDKGGYVHGFYRHPDGEVVGPIYRD